MRDTIVYTHLNPWRAKLCADDMAYEWTSRAAYLPGSSPTEFGIRPDPPLPDLRDYILGQLDRCAPGHSITHLRGSWLPRSVARSRIRLIRAATHRGFRTCEIARFFDISPQSVSRAKYAPHD